MIDTKLLNYIKEVLNNMPAGWLSQTTHRLDIYNESLAKVQFLEQLETLFKEGDSSTKSLKGLPTAFDYIRLGHPLSSLLEWVIASLNNLNSENVISFSSKTIPVLAILRKNLLENKNTRIVHTGGVEDLFDVEVLQNIYGYKFSLEQVKDVKDISAFDGSTVFVSQQKNLQNITINQNIDFYVNVHQSFGSVVLVTGNNSDEYVSEIQHVRRRETIAMTPESSLMALKSLISEEPKESLRDDNKNRSYVTNLVNKTTGTDTRVLIGSCGLSIQYAILMGLVHDSIKNHVGRNIKIVVPPNCYGGTNDQARRVAACVDNVEVVDLPVDGGQDMVKSVDVVLNELAVKGDVPLIIAEIPTNPRVEVPNLIKLEEALGKKRKTKNGEDTVEPVFILDQTFCPNVKFLGESDVLSKIKTISYVSGSKFPSGGKCTSGYCVANKKADHLMGEIEKHLKICDNEATSHQLETLSKQLPSMNQRINDAYKNTRELVNFIKETLPEAKINFVSKELAEAGFTPSVFSLDLPTKGSSSEERESYKRKLNHKLINLMIERVPDESKHCVSYGQLQGCYWTIPATSTQGTTKESDKDYIVRVAVSPDMDVELHKKVFLEFVKSI